ncbi:VWA domain-containing protein [Rhodobacter sp. Har01]|uniref:vWA domain-containing protein n=1 Tax=Rhodobacter sp. Har01 TaxID=2883999 RepID=UPI001D08C6A1|nr:VWA domain-containing protein [Rhodobacter sp. Har01]MCB6177305.1 VWA domain-containing protein [Rhodobacter sp. Har01]
MRLLPALLLGSTLLSSVALAEGRSIIVLDASGSMWGQIDGRAKLEIAREALASVLGSLPAETEIGLMAYGHRTKGDCSDIELVVPPAAGTGQAIIDAANAMKFLGKTPLTEAVRQAAAELKSTEAKATVILITDGIETCNADPCALGAELENSGVDFTAHVVGFGLTEEEGRAVACLAENTGGKYIQAADAGALVEALKTTVVLAEPEPEPQPEPQPAVVENNVDLVTYLAPGGPGLPADLVETVYADFYAVGPDGAVATEVTNTLYGTAKGTLPPGKYVMKTVMHQIIDEQQVEVPAGAPVSPVAVLEAGVFDIAVTATEGGEPDNGAYWELRGPEGFVEYSYATGRRVVPSGEYALKVTLGAAELNETVVIDAGQIVEKRVVMGIGVAAIDAWYTDAMKVDGSEHFVEVFKPEKDLDGNRISVVYTYGAGAAFDLPPGDYVAVVTLGAAKVEQPFSIKAGQRSDIKVVLNAGVAAFATPGDEFIEIVSPTKDINGNRASFGYSYGPDWQTTLPAGDYVALVGSSDPKTETPFTVKAGERVELSLGGP